MELLLQRLSHTDTLTTSVLFVDRVLYAVVPEDPPQNVKVKGNTRIPAGRYRLVLEHSPKFSDAYGKRFGVADYKMLTVADVPDFIGIRMHTGNSPKDTAGCILPNAHLMVNADSDDTFYISELAYKAVYHEVAPFIERGGEAWITVQDEGVLFPNVTPLSVA